MILNDPVVSAILTDVWYALPDRFAGLQLDEFVIMPNHVHFLVWLGQPQRKSTAAILQDGPDRTPEPAHDWILPKPNGQIKNASLGDLVGSWKSLVVTVYLDWIKRHDPHRKAKIWQRNFYDRIVRNDRALRAIRQYIRDNPRNWQHDPDNPQNLAGLPFPKRIDDYLTDVRRSA